MKRKKLQFLLLVGLLITGLSQGTVSAQDELDNLDPLDSEDIDVTGSFKRETEADRLAKERQKLEQQNQDMVSKKIEDLRIANERKMTKQLRDAFNGKAPIQQDEVSTSAAAEEKIEATVETQKPLSEFRVIPSFGVQNVAGESFDFESKLFTGLSLDAMVSRHISVGLNINYTTMDILLDPNNGFGGFSSSFNGFYNTYAPTYGYNNFNNAFNSFYGANYTSAFGSQGREIGYKRFGAEVTSKFFLFPDKRVRPYAGLGIGYNRSSLKYKQTTQTQNPYQWNGYSLGGEQFSSSYVSGAALLGGEVSFTESFGINLEVRYQKALTSGFNGQSASTFAFNPDQQRLEDLGRAIQDSDLFSLSAGILITF